MDEQPQWNAMGQRSRRPFSGLRVSELPDEPGVYALYRSGERMYVGLAGNLRQRWGAHLSRGLSMTNSALRRNVAEHRGIATAADIKAGRYRPSADDACRVSAWLDECDVAWATCDSRRAAKRLEDGMKAEFKPPLTKQ